MSLIIIITLALGIGAGMYLPEGSISFFDSLSSIMLYLLIFSVGIDIGNNSDVFLKIKQMGFRILLIPLGVIIGSWIGAGVLSFFIEQSLKESIAISSGFGWYSLSGVIITEAGYPVNGTISFLSNVFREVLTFIFVPFIARNLNYYSAIAPAGATAMDTTLAIISRNTNGKIAIIAFISGFSITLVVPILIPLFL